MIALQAVDWVVRLVEQETSSLFLQARFPRCFWQALNHPDIPHDTRAILFVYDTLWCLAVRTASIESEVGQRAIFLAAPPQNAPDECREEAHVSIGPPAIKRPQSSKRRPRKGRTPKISGQQTRTARSARPVQIRTSLFFPYGALSEVLEPTRGVPCHHLPIKWQPPSPISAADVVTVGSSIR